MNEDIELNSKLIHDLEFNIRKNKSESFAFSKACVIGGGAAGFITGIALRHRFPDKKITLIESPNIPIIGVGEATTLNIKHLLFRVMGLDPTEFYHEVRPTFKLGLRFYWDIDQTKYFDVPFRKGGWALCREAMHFDGRLSEYSLNAALMAEKRIPFYYDEMVKSYRALPRAPYAFHMDNARFVSYLKKHFCRIGGRYVRGTVSQVAIDQQTNHVRFVKTEEGKKYGAEIFMDCSGFRSLLIGKTLNSQYLSYSNSLLNDTALIAQASQAERLDSFTTLHAWQNGWSWQIPQYDSNHVGYVYSSQFTSKENAQEELQSHFDLLGQIKKVDFRPGRFQDCWRGNVIAIGNAYGFIEPLESTSLSLIGKSVKLALDLLTGYGPDETVKKTFNQKIGMLWDQVAAFIMIHFRFSRRNDTAYWRACRSLPLMNKHCETMISLYKRGSAYRLSDEPGGFLDIDYENLLFGLGVDREIASYQTQDRKNQLTWKIRKDAIMRLAKRGLPAKEAEVFMSNEKSMFSLKENKARGHFANERTLAEVS